MDPIIGGFASVGKVFSYVGLFVGVILGILLIVLGSYYLKDNYDATPGTISSIIPTRVQYTYNGSTYTSILLNTNNHVYSLDQKITVFIRTSQPDQAYAQPTTKGFGIGLIAVGFVVITVGMLNTYFVRKNPAYASVVGFSDVLSIGRKHPLFGLI